MKLFLCTTLLQLAIASRIIEKLELDPSEITVAYISRTNNRLTINAINGMEKFSDDVIFIELKHTHSLLNFFNIFRSFFLKKYSCVYLASIENRYIHFILSRIYFESLFTFDDGTANIFPDSTYRIERQTSFVSNIRNFVFKINYSMIIIKERSRLHYTIYKNHSNIISDIEYIDPVIIKIDNNEVCKNSCNVMLGTVYTELFDKSIDINTVIDQCLSHLKQTKRKTYYIPHPKEASNPLPNNITVIDANYIAEKEVELLLRKYKTIYLYGFMSSCQFNLMPLDRVVNSCFYSDRMLNLYKNTMNNIEFSAGFNIIKID